MVLGEPTHFERVHNVESLSNTGFQNINNNPDLSVSLATQTMDLLIHSTVRPRIFQSHDQGQRFKL